MDCHHTHTRQATAGEKYPRILRVHGSGTQYQQEQHGGAHCKRSHISYKIPHRCFRGKLDW